MEQVLQAAGVETQILTVGAEQTGGCTACGGCNATGHCVRGGLVNDAIDAMETADALVLASPVHYAGISGAMSAFCDRLFYAGDGWANKPCACVVSARRAGTTAALDQLVKYPMISNMPVVSSQYWPMVHGARPEDVAQDEEACRPCASSRAICSGCCSASRRGTPPVFRARRRKCASSPISSADFRRYHEKRPPQAKPAEGVLLPGERCSPVFFFARRLPVMCSTVRHRTVVAGMTAFAYGKSGARYCAMSTRSARSLSASGTTAMRPDR